MLEYNKKVKMAYLFYKIIGLEPFSITAKRHIARKNIPYCTCSYLGSIYNFFLIIIHITLYYIFSLNADNAFTTNETQLTKAILKFKIALGCIVLISTWTLLWVNQKKAVIILNKLVSIDTNMILKLHHIYSIKPVKYNYLILCIINLVTWILVVVSDYYIDFPLSWVWWCFNGPNFISSWLIMQYVFMVNMLQTRYKSFNHSICKLVNKINKLDDFKLSDDITLLKYMHNLLYEVSKELADFFSIPTLMIVTYFCVTIIITSYYCITTYMHIQSYLAFMIISNSLFYLATEVFPIITLTNKITNLMEEMRTTVHMVHKLLNTANIHDKQKLQLRQFSVELLDKNMQFSAYEFFPLDNSLLYLISNTIMTYLIILIQFNTNGEEEDHFANVYEDF